MKIFKKVFGGTDQNKTPFTRLGELHAPKDSKRRLTYYQKYFRGYTEVRKLDSKGRVKVERHYTQPWIVSGLSKGRYWLLRLLYLVLMLGAVVCFVLALIQRIPGNYFWAVVVPAYVSALLLFMLVISIFSYLFVERKMTLWTHHTSTTKLKRYALAACVGQLVTAVAMALVACITRISVSESLLCAGLALLAAVCSGAIWWIEGRVPYQELPNETKLPNGQRQEIW